MSPIPVFEGVGVCAGPRQFLKDLHFQIQDREWLSIIGPNGSGKTTLLHALSGWIPHQGTLRFRGQSLTEISPIQMARNVAVLRNDEAPVFGFSVGEFVESGTFPLRGEAGPRGPRSATPLEVARESLDRVGAGALWDRSITTLSSGEFQRVYFARTLAQQTAVVLLDEPSAHLDPGHESACFELLAQLQRESAKTVVCVVHDLAFASRFSDRILLLREGRILALGTPFEVLTPENLHSAYDCPFRLEPDPVSQRPIPRAENPRGWPAFSPTCPP